MTTKEFDIHQIKNKKGVKGDVYGAKLKHTINENHGFVT